MQLLEREARPELVDQPLSTESRNLSARHFAVLWGDLGIGLLVLVTGALLVPALGFATAMVAVVIGSLIGVGLLATAASIGARAGVATMVLFRPVLGVRGSWIPTALNVVQLVGWTAVELWAMSFVADLVSERVFGFSARWLWLAFFALLCTTLALWGPVGVTRVWLEKFSVWVIGAIALAVTVLVFTSGGLGGALGAPGLGGFPTFGAALDLVIAMPISWLPLVADYTRFASSPRSAFVGTFWGYLIANVWLYALGALLILGAGAAPSPEGIAAGVLAVAGGSIAGVLFLVGLVVGESDEAFANIYSGAISLQNIWPRVSRSAFILLIAGIGVALAAVLDMVLYESFLFLIGSIFVPLFGVLFAHHLLSRRGTSADSSPRSWKGRAFIPWVAGFLLYHWIAPSPLEWWATGVRSLVGSPLGERFTWLGASVPALLLSFLLAAFLGRGYHQGSAERLS